MLNKKIETILALRRAFSLPDFEKVVEKACVDNVWFTPQMVHFAVDSIVNQMLNKTKIKGWLSRYEIDYNNSRRVGIICAGNIPLVGFYDLMCAILCGHSVTVKPSSKDRVLMEYVCSFIDADIDIVETIDRYDIDMLIATGSDKTAESVSEKYKGVKSLIRHSRKSVAKLDGSETDEQLRGLNDDVFLYFGLGCRNVSHIFIPKGYDFSRLIEFLKPYKGEVYTEKYRFEKAMSVMKNEPFINGNGFLFKEQDYTLSAPLGTIGYSYCENKIELDYNLVQCTVNVENSPVNVDFGQTQFPCLSDAPDQKDVIMFLNSK